MGEVKPQALLSPQDSLQRASPLRAWTGAQRQALQGALAETLADWCAGWGLADRARTPQVELLDRAAGPAAQRPGARILRDTASAVQALQGVLLGERAAASFGAAEAPSVAGELAQAAWQDWMGRLEQLLALAPGLALACLGLSAAGGAAGRGTGAQPRPWSGDLWARLPWGREILELRIEAAQVEAWLQRCAAPLLRTAEPRGPAPPPRVRLDQALAARSLAVRAEFGAVTLTLGQLQELRIGDVVALPHRLEQPLTLHLAQDDAPPGPMLCHGWLGRVQGQMAVELARQA